MELIKFEKCEKIEEMMIGCVLVNSLINRNVIFIFGGSNGKEACSNVL